MDIYLDNHATTQIDPIVLEAMIPYLSSEYGNASSRTHRFGYTARNAVEKSRKLIASILNCDSNEIIFTSGATESNNIALLGTFLYHWNLDKHSEYHIVVSSIEHKSVLDTCHFLDKLFGCKVTYVHPNNEGIVDPLKVFDSIRSNTILVSIMGANNEIGTIQDIRNISDYCNERKIPFHTDYAQCLGKLPIDLNEVKVTMLSASAHKIYGPKGIGFLFIRNSHNIYSTQRGGGQENGLRSGTLNVPGIIGIAKALELMVENYAEETERIKNLRDFLWSNLSNVDGIFVNGTMERRLVNNLSVRINNVDSETLFMSLPNIAISSGSACNSENILPSYVLLNIGLTKEEALSSIRFGLGRYTTYLDIVEASTQLIETIYRLRTMVSAKLEINEEDERIIKLI